MVLPSKPLRFHGSTFNVQRDRLVLVDWTFWDFVEPGASGTAFVIAGEATSDLSLGCPSRFDAIESRVRRDYNGQEFLMESVGVAELKAKLSQYLAKVRAGEEIA